MLWYLFGILCDLGSFACAMASLLSQYRSIGLDALGTTSDLEIKFLIYTTSFVASKAAIYSTSIGTFLELF
jgi:hypothetical protein